MRGSTLVSRVARFQTAVGFVALMLVFAGTMGVVDRLLVWKTDHHLRSVMDRVVKYLDSTEPATIDFRWLAGEVEEIRPPDLRVEVADHLGQRRVAAGPGQAPLGPADGCVSQGAVRGCALAHRQFFVRAARDRSDDRDVEWQVAGALLGACGWSALASR